MSKQNIALIAIAVISSLGAFSIAYQSLVVIPQKQIDAQILQAEQDRLSEALAEDRREARYGACLKSAFKSYTTNWDAQCELVGKESDCSLPNYTAEIFESRKDKDEEACLAIYKAN